MNGSCNKQNANGNSHFYEGTDGYSYEEINKIADYLRERIKIVPKIGIICGSGLGSMGETIQDATYFDYKNIPNFPVSTVQGHKGRLIFGHISGVPVMCMQGRFHFYEGYSLAKCAMPVKLMKLMGATHLIASNAAGGLNPKFKIGDIMIIKDHVNFMGFSGNHPLRGPHEPRFGSRFFAMSKAYDPTIIKNVKQIANSLGIQDTVHEGVFTCLGGPNYETIAELKVMSILGIDAVGMSTVHEIITAKSCGMTSFAFSLITNICVTDYDSLEEPDGDEVLDVGKAKEKDLKVFVEKIIDMIGNEM